MAMRIKKARTPERQNAGKQDRSAGLLPRIVTLNGAGTHLNGKYAKTAKGKQEKEHKQRRDAETQRKKDDNTENRGNPLWGAGRPRPHSKPQELGPIFCRRLLWVEAVVPLVCVFCVEFSLSWSRSYS